MDTAKKRWRVRRRRVLNLPRYTLGEEITNAITHGAGALAALVGFIVLLAQGRNDFRTFVSICIYGGTLVMLYTVSTLYHALGINKGKKVFQILDHCTVYLLIAGTYTPIALIAFGGTIGWVIVGIVWGVTILGIVLNAVNMKKFRVISMICYLTLGWLVIFFIRTLLESLDVNSIILLIAGGVCYTVGAVIFGLGRKIPYMHSLWHLFVLGGSIFHYFVIYSIAVG